MPYRLDDKLVIGISSRALFNLEKEHELFTTHGQEAYIEYMRKHEDDPVEPGTGFPIVKALLGINNCLADRLVEVVIVSHNTLIPDFES